MNADLSPVSLLEAPPHIQSKAVPILRWRISDGATAITVLVVLAFTIVMVLPGSRGEGLGKFTVEHVQLLHMVDTGAQRLADRIGLIMLALFCVVGAVTITLPAAYNPTVTGLLRTMGNFFKRWSGIFCAAAAALVLLFDLPGTVFPAPARTRLLLEIFILSLLLTVLALVAAQRREINISVWAIWGFVAAYSFFLTIPGLIRTPIVFEPELSWAEWHYSATLAQADRLAAGLRVGSQVNLNYGLTHTLALAMIERTWGLLDFGGHVRLVQVSQIAFLAVALLAFYLWRPDKPLYVLFGALWIGPWVSTSQFGMFYPNQAGWRSIGLAAGIATLLLCRQSVARAAWILGAAGSFLVLYNPETGLCLAFGYGLFLLSRRKDLSLGQIAGLALRAAIGALIVLLAVLLIFRAGLGTWPFFDTALLFGLIGRFGQGYGGLPIYFDPLALLIFLHSTFVVAASVLKWRRRDLEFDESVKLGISATILAWSAYFVNRPHAWNLWTYQFLYFFMLADLMDPRLLRRLSHRGIAAAVFDFRISALTFVLVPVVLYMNWTNFLATVSPGGRPEVSAAMVSGILVPQDSAELLRTQAGFLAAQTADTLFFSRHSYSLSLLTKRFNALPSQDVFAETATSSDFERLVAEINKIGPRRILFDAPTFQLLGAENRVIYYYNMHFFERLKNRLSERYDESGSTSGWQVWRLRIPQDDPGIPRKKFDPQG